MVTQVADLLLEGSNLLRLNLNCILLSLRSPSVGEMVVTQPKTH